MAFIFDEQRGRSMDIARQRSAAVATPRVEVYVNTGDSCPHLRVKYDVDIREFVILACIKDADVAGEDEV